MNLLDELSPRELLALRYDWQFWARDAQRLPDAVAWRVWLILAGRGWGKTRTGAESIRRFVESGLAKRIALVGETWADVRDVMIEGESGILSISPPWFRPEFEISKRRLVWPNGAQAQGFSAQEPDQLRGPQFDLAWCDELAKWPHPQMWVNLLFSLRLGENPQAIVTTTPKPLKWIKYLASRPDTFVTRGSTYENSWNLAPAFLDEIISRYEGTRIGRQEIHAHFLEDTPGALWTREILDKATRKDLPRDFERVVVAVDPAVGHGAGAAETGIIVAARKDGVAYVLADLSCKLPPSQWARRAVDAYHDYSADRLIAEANQGGDLVEEMIRHIDTHIAYRPVRATRGKMIRAEPVAALYEQGKVWHAPGLNQLEDQMCSYTGEGTSPDRLDALVWALTYLMLKPALPSAMARTRGW